MDAHNVSTDQSFETEAHSKKGAWDDKVSGASEVTNDTISLWERGLRRPENKQLVIREMIERTLIADDAQGKLKPERMYTVKITKNGDEEWWIGVAAKRKLLGVFEGTIETRAEFEFWGEVWYLKMKIRKNGQNFVFYI